MAATGGDILEIAYTHPTLGSGRFFPKAGETSTFNTGGFMTADDDNGITGSGMPIYKMNNTRWSLETACASDMVTAKDMETYSALAASPEEAEFTIAHINGITYRGKGKPVGDKSTDGNEATFKLKIAGGGGLQQI